MHKAQQWAARGATCNTLLTLQIEGNQGAVLPCSRRRYDPDDTITTWAVVIGMAVMAASLLLFAI
jgi:hypothetical protein